MPSGIGTVTRWGSNPTGFKDSADGKFWLDDNANPQSSQAEVAERWRRPDFHHLDLELTWHRSGLLHEACALHAALGARRRGVKR